MITGGFIDFSMRPSPWRKRMLLNQRRHRAARYLYADYLANLCEVNVYEQEFPLPFHQWLARSFAIFRGEEEWFKEDTPEWLIDKNGSLKEENPILEVA